MRTLTITERLVCSQSSTVGPDVHADSFNERLAHWKSASVTWRIPCMLPMAERPISVVARPSRLRPAPTSSTALARMRLTR